MRLKETMYLGAAGRGRLAVESPDLLQYLRYLTLGVSFVEISQ